MKNSWRIGELARQAGLSTDSLRHYERLGLLPKPKRMPNGYRVYAPETLHRIQVIQAALSVGFNLKEVSRILRIRDNGGAPCREVRDLASAKLHLIEEQIRLMQSARAHLKKVIESWDQTLHSSAPGARAGLLDGLAGSNHMPRWNRKPRK